ncbi:hypothetical protein ES703_115340 [subsurface metagenome]
MEKWLLSLVMVPYALIFGALGVGFTLDGDWPLGVLRCFCCLGFVVIGVVGYLLGKEYEAHA